MGTEVLRPQNCLIDRIRVAPVVFPRRRPNRKPASRPERPDPRKRSIHPEASSSKSSGFFDLRSDRIGGGAQVTILRRGESLDSKIKSRALNQNGGGVVPEMIACGTERIGPEPEMVPKQIRIRGGARSGSPTPRARPDIYAGSAFALSPAPSSLPLPSFYKKEQALFGAAVDDSATRDLRRILRLD